MIKSKKEKENIGKNLEGGSNGVSEEISSCLPSSESKGRDVSSSIQGEEGDLRSH